MYIRKEIKEKAKISFKANYWRSVLICLIVGAINGALVSTSGSTVVNSTIQAAGNTDNFKDAVEIITSSDGAVLMAIIAVMMAVLILCALIGIAIRAFVINPFDIGGCRFFVTNSSEQAEIGEIIGGFRKPSYMRNVAGMLLRDLFVFLGYLVLFIPGIIVSYGLRLVPHILADTPDIGPMDAIKLSYARMRGYKWKAFVLELSFIGWDILNMFTLGFLNLFYVGPYKAQAHAEFYLKVMELTADRAG